VQHQQEEMFYHFQFEWHSCKRSFDRLEIVVKEDVRIIAQPYDPNKSDSGPDWFLFLLGVTSKIDRALFDSNVTELGEHLSAFGDGVDKFLYSADKSLRKVVNEINQLSHLGFYIARSQ
jgi:hypothetical protein